ncbi:MAG: helix-turn-helix transcriptional regulator [Bacteroidales bacterium]|nr:helix-turn-helix transcriptional regulator [Bacteroidales bacterium]
MVNLSLIKDLCKQKGISLKKLADDIGISQTGLTSAIKNNGTTLETLDKIAKYLNVSVGVFFGEDANNSLVDTLKRKVGFAQFDSSFTYIIGYWAKQKDPIIKGKKVSKYDHINSLTEDGEGLFEDNRTHGYENDIIRQFTDLFSNQKTKREDFIILKDNGVISKECCKMLVLWAECDYEISELVKKYEQYLLMQSIDGI